MKLILNDKILKKVASVLAEISYENQSISSLLVNLESAKGLITQNI